VHVLVLVLVNVLDGKSEHVRVHGQRRLDASTHSYSVAPALPTSRLHRLEAGGSAV
jgi:hypothetical protein